MSDNTVMVEELRLANHPGLVRNRMWSSDGILLREWWDDDGSTLPGGVLVPVIRVSGSNPGAVAENLTK